MAFYEQPFSAVMGKGFPDKPDPQLIEQYAPLVKYIAGRIAIGLPHHVDVNDLYGYGILGLADALSKYAPGKGAKFETYASIRIKGAIYDGLRKMDWFPNSVRTKARELERTMLQLEARLGRTPESLEIAGELGMSLNDYYKRLDEIKAINLVSLEESLGQDTEQDITLKDIVDDPRASMDFLQVERKEVQNILAEAIERLPYKEKIVVSLYYHEELTLKEIGRVLGVSESRVSQLHSQAVLRLRGRLSRVKKKLI